LFPLIVAGIRSVKKAIAFSCFCIVTACLANDAVRGLLLQNYGQFAADTFLYYWLPNQLFVFAIGTVLYFVIDSVNKRGDTYDLGWRSPLLLSVCVAAMVALGEYPTLTPGIWTLNPFRGPPLVFWATLLMFLAAVLIAANSKGFIVNKPIRALGTVSFSAYLSHFFVVHQLADTPIIDAAHRVGVGAILACGLLFALTVPLTFAISWLTYRYVEEPMISVGARLAASMNSSSARNAS
jgi:peptidoglycan/LPS O-acetylase OafA/YrhL